ncbi:MAG TPA: hypothetical protein VGK73_08425 [Polyangiaceae bacterium]
MVERIGGIAPLAGSLTLLVADGNAARAWRGDDQPNDPIRAFHAARAAGGPSSAPVALGDATGWLVKLGAEQRDATVFRLAGDRVAIVGPYWEWREEMRDEEKPPIDPREIEALIAESDGERIGTLDVPSGRLLVADARGSLTGEPSRAPAELPPELRTQMEQTSVEAAERRAKVIGNLEEVRKHMAACPLEDRDAFFKMIRRTLEGSAEGACAHLTLFGGTSAVIRADTGDLMLVVPPGSYALAFREVSFHDEQLGILHLLPSHRSP